MGNVPQGRLDGCRKAPRDRRRRSHALAGPPCLMGKRFPCLRGGGHGIEAASARALCTGLAGLPFYAAAVRAALVSTPDARLLLRQILFQEGAESKDVTTLDSLYRLQGSNPFSLVTPQQQVAAAAQLHIAAQNRMRIAANDRICGILATTTGAGLPAIPETWWQWWNDTNEVYVEGEKPITTAYYLEEITVVSPPLVPLHSSPSGSGNDDNHKDCLVARRRSGPNAAPWPSTQGSGSVTCCSRKTSKQANSHSSRS